MLVIDFKNRELSNTATAKAIVRISVIGGVAYVDQVPSGVTVEVTDYDVSTASCERDERGHPCSRYCVPSEMVAAV